MSAQKETWTYLEFLAYLLLFAANADLETREEEKEVLLIKVNSEEYDRVLKHFEKDNDSLRLQTIKSFREKYYKDPAAQERLMNDLKDMFLADEKYSSEKKAFHGL